LVKWRKFATPKELGGWGLKNIHFFAQALAARSLWSLIDCETLWGCVMKSNDPDYFRHEMREKI
jgi:hypothetical protein